MYDIIYLNDIILCTQSEAEMKECYKELREKLITRKQYRN